MGRSEPRRIAVHDFSGHPFQVQLSRELARRGHSVLHLHCPSYNSGKGALSRKASDPPSFATVPVPLSRQFEKYSPVRRGAQEQSYGRRVSRHLKAFSPDVVLSSNTPLFSQRIILGTSRANRWRFVFWQQDIYSHGMRNAVANYPIVGGMVGNLFVSLEARLVRASDATVVISPDFVGTLREWGVPTERIHVIENWAPLDELSVGDRDNAWRKENDLGSELILLYSGTLGKKHDPGLLLGLALHLQERTDVVLVVASEGSGCNWLRQQVLEHRLKNVRITGFQPYERMSEVLAAGDIMLVILENDAGAFSVPSKVLSYQCAGRPLLARVPAENLSGRRIRESNSGVVVSSDEQFVHQAGILIDSPDLRHELGTNARKYAERTFDISTIADRFERVLVPTD